MATIRFAEDFVRKLLGALDGAEKLFIDDEQYVELDDVIERAIGAPDGSTPGSVLARLDTNEDDIASLGAAVGPLPVAIDALEAIVGTVRTVTGNATLDGTEGIVIIDAAGSVEITVDAGAAARRVRVLRIGDASLYATVFKRDADAGTINGAASSYTVYGTTTAGISIDLWATAAHEWHTSTTVYETLVELVGTTIPAIHAGTVPAANILRTTTAGPHTIGASISDVCQAYAGAMTYEMPAATVGRRVSIVKETTNAGTITLDPAGSDTIHGSASNYVLDGSDYVTSATTYRRAWTAVCYVAGEWQIT